MKQAFKRIAFVLSALMLALTLSVTAFADSVITFKGSREGFGVDTGSEYSANDLFDSFKNVMPGDKLSQNIKIKNVAKDCDYIKVYLKSDAENDELTKDFLSKLTMRVYNGTRLVYDASPDEAGALANSVLLGTVYPNESLDLRVELDVPIELGDEYANRIGEVEWIFTAECIDLRNLTVHKVWNDNLYPERPESVTVHLMRNGERFKTAELSASNQWTYTWADLANNFNWSVVEEVPFGYKATYKSQDNQIFITNSMDYVPADDDQPEDPAESATDEEEELVSLTVKKVWANGKASAESVTVTLYNGDEAAEKVTLGEWNGWTYTWENLDASGNWSVIETGIPKGCVPSYHTEGNVVIVTNTPASSQGIVSTVLLILAAVCAVIAVVIVFAKKKKN